MHLTCPSCETTFAVDPQQIGSAGRRVRCGSCGHEWFQEPLSAEDSAGSEVEAGAAEDVAEADRPSESTDGAPSDGEPSPPGEPERRARARRRPPPPKPKRRGLVIGWLLLILVAGSLAAGAYFERQRIVSAVPAAEDLYNLVGLSGLPPLGAGLEFRDVKTARRTIDGEPVVAVEGLVVNISDSPREVPLMRASLMDSSGRTVEQWTFSAAETLLPPGAKTKFETTTRKVPKDGNLSIDFVAAKK